ncbi:MAG TPA: hypothetical protein VEH27_16660 [Methylomirabilota bacterium]|nr:hypothetical protein [Methylomirabilota bacterium]
MPRRPSTFLAWFIRLFIVAPLISWLLYLNWAGPKYEGRRIKQWERLALEPDARYSDDNHFNEAVVVLQTFKPQLGGNLLGSIPSMSDSGAPGPIGWLAAKLPSNLGSRFSIHTPADKKAAAIMLAAELKPPRELAEPILLSQLTSRSTQVRYAALGGLVTLKIPTERHITSFLKSSDPEVQMNGLHLAYFRRESTAPWFKELRSLSQNPKQSPEGVWATRLLPWAGPDALPAIKSALASTNDLVVRLLLAGIRSAPKHLKFSQELAPELLKHCDLSKDRPSTNAQSALHALGRLERFTPELRGVAIELYSTGNNRRLGGLKQALDASQATPAQICDIFIEALPQTKPKDLDRYVIGLCEFAYGTPFVYRQRPRSLVTATNALDLAHTLMNHIEGPRLRRHPLVLTLLPLLAPDAPQVHSHLASLARSGDPAIVSYALWALPRTSLGVEERMKIVSHLWRDPRTPPMPLFYLLHSCGEAAAPLLPEIEMIATTPDHPWRDQAIKFLNQYQTQTPWSPRHTHAAHVGYPEILVYEGKLKLHSK